MPEQPERFMLVLLGIALIGAGAYLHLSGIVLL